MRISTSSIFETASSQMSSLQTALVRTQEQISSNRKNLTPADDPIASARALEVTQSQAMNTQFQTNRDNAKSSLSHVDLALGSVTSLIQDVQTLVVSAGNGALNNSDRAGMATELEGRYNDLLALANTTDGVGGHLFAGFRTNTEPFTRTSTGATYNGDDGQRQLQVSSARQINVSAAGSAVFDSVMTGNGSFVTQSAPGNDSTVSISAGSVTDASKLTGNSYQIDFTSPTEYTITNMSKTPIVAGSAEQYSEGKPINIDGMQFNIRGNPAVGDSFTIDKSKKESIFTTMAKLLDVLRAPADDAAGRAALSAGLASAQNGLKNGLDNVLTTRTTVGSNLKEIDYLDGAGADLNVQYATTLSGLQDLDLFKAFSMLTQQQLTLQAAQKSFASMSSLSLFNYIN
jgi:flagellar hook-associated protein 3 FlgL